MSEEMRHGLVDLCIECVVEKSNEKGKVWVKPIGRRYLVNEKRVHYEKKGASDKEEK